MCVCMRGKRVDPFNSSLKKSTFICFTWLLLFFFLSFLEMNRMCRGGDFTNISALWHLLNCIIIKEKWAVLYYFWKILGTVVNIFRYRAELRNSEGECTWNLFSSTGFEEQRQLVWDSSKCVSVTFSKYRHVTQLRFFKKGFFFFFFHYYYPVK